MVSQLMNFQTHSMKENGINTLEFRYPMAEPDCYFKFQNWLESEFDLYQQDKQFNKLVIYYPRIKCVIQKVGRKDNTNACVIIVSKTRILCDEFEKKISEIYHLLDSQYFTTE